MATTTEGDDAVRKKIAELPAFQDDATDKLMPSAWFLTELDGPTEDRIAEIVRTAAR